NPDRVIVASATQSLFEALRDPAWANATVGLAAYDAGARDAVGPRPSIWPDLILARYPSRLRFDHDLKSVQAIGCGASPAQAQAAAQTAAAWLKAKDAVPALAPPAASFEPEASDEAYRVAVADVVDRIGKGELFQANIARAWTGGLRPGAEPFDVFLRLQGGAASAFGAYWRIGDRALVSNSPELFVELDARTRRIEARPIKGTRPRGGERQVDKILARDLSESGKDRAENLMIVDLMRNDLARVSEPGSVKVETLFEVETLPTVHHLVSTVTGRARPEISAADLLEAAFPAGSITGAPKHQAMKVIAQLEPPRGAWCGSLFLVEEAGSMTASVLIRTASFERSDGRWSYRTQAGAGIVADSRPQAELDETAVKISAMRGALIGEAS
ncbi:hypothetical protein LTR94_024173, partial [Friedmanniomyces endolithicus]